MSINNIKVRQRKNTVRPSTLGKRYCQSTCPLKLKALIQVPINVIHSLQAMMEKDPYQAVDEKRHPLFRDTCIRDDCRLPGWREALGPGARPQGGEEIAWMSSARDRSVGFPKAILSSHRTKHLNGITKMATCGGSSVKCGVVVAGVSPCLRFSNPPQATTWHFGRRSPIRRELRGKSIVEPVAGSNHR